MDRPTVDRYEAEAARYEAQRTPRHRAQAEALGARVEGGLAVDLGSGPGWYTDALGQPAVALDAAFAMLRRTREVAPSCLPVQADLSALPFRRGSLHGAWARNTYVHLRAVDVPAALADLHAALAVGAPVELTFFGGDREGRDVFPEDDLPGRWFSTWSRDRLEDVILGAGFELEELAESGSAGEPVLTVRATRARTLPDTVGPDLRLLVCGLNPSLHAADAGVGFVTPGNRFWPAALAVGLVTRDRDPRHALGAHRVGMTDLVKRATPRADALTRAEYLEGVARLDRLGAWLRPAAVCVVGLAGWRAAVHRTAQPGWQDRTLGGAPVYVMPSTSGLNATTSLSDLTHHLRLALTPPPAPPPPPNTPRSGADS
ncbi:MAG TPA: uracil-DNA glycosylase family protein [Acidimicrobiales bacterium]|nr:uracil-DNA glycosylase family protein [Acidimicrobiales bacterium]